MFTLTCLPHEERGATLAASQRTPTTARIGPAPPRDRASDDGRLDGFDVVVARNADQVWITPCGEADLVTTSRLERELVRALADGSQRLVVDLSNLTFMDLFGMRALLRCRKSAQDKGIALILIPGTRGPRRLMEICGALEQFELLKPEKTD
jgi:anti-anti-sigma factor